ncbi:MAG: hypothetical protein HOP28_11740, partial [Gemmatimonadales bacterium]|nr:hypothetical protein [Gemmatimonadales bacterium]
MHLVHSLGRALTRGLAAWTLLATTVAAQAPARQNGDAAPDLASSRARLAAETYVAPPAEVAKLVTAPRHLNVVLTQQSPDRTHFLREISEGMPTVAKFGKPHYYFAGLQVDGAANRARSLTTRGLARLEVVEATTGRATLIEIPAGALASGATWSPDGRQIAFVANFDKASHVYVADIATGKSRALTPTKSPLLATLVTSVDWTSGGGSIVTVVVPENRSTEPTAPPVATGPKVALWLDGAKSPQRQFASLLEVPFEQQLMEYYVTGQLVTIDVKTRAVQKIGAPAMISNVDPSPDGKYFRVTTMKKPFSYVVQYGSFGTVEEVWDASGKVLAEVAKRPLREVADTSSIPAAQRTDGGRRSVAWMPQGEGLYYLEAIAPARGRPDSAATAGAPAGGANARPDRLVKWSPPFGAGDTTTLYRSDAPIAQMVMSDDATTVFFGVNRSGTGELFAVKLSEPEKKLQ